MMKTLISVLLGSLLLASTAACSNVSKTSEDAPASTNTTTEAPETNEAKDINKDGTSELRKRQLNSDIRAREQRNQMAGENADRSDNDIQSEVRSKLEANLPASQLAVKAEDGKVSISGTVPTEPQLRRIEPLAKEIYGVNDVDVNVTIVPAKRQS